MDTYTKRSIAAIVLFAATLVSFPTFAGNPYWSAEELERSRAHALRERCMDANGRCIEAMMLGDNSQYRCKMTRQHRVSTPPTVRSGWYSTMFCL
ncbi:MAG: hypothetical protein ACREXT_13510 [Gammaproteobacteria bacterium]